MKRPTAAALLLLAAAGALAAGCSLVEGAREERKERNRPLRQVTAPVAFEMLRDSPELSILDLRGHDAFHGPLGHIRGALNVPVADLEARLREISYLHNRTFIVYCRAQCERPVLERLAAEGFVDAMHLHGGLEAWLAKGFGTVGAGAPPEHSDDVRGVVGDPS